MMALDEDKGFTLLEVVVAIAILALALGALYPVFGTSIRRVDVVEKRSYGLTLAESKMQEHLLLADYDALPLSGEADGWEWHVEGADYADETDDPDSSDFLYKLTVTATPPSRQYGNSIILERIVYRRR